MCAEPIKTVSIVRETAAAGRQGLMGLMFRGQAIRGTFQPVGQVCTYEPLPEDVRGKSKTGRDRARETPFCENLSKTLTYSCGFCAFSVSVSTAVSCVGFSSLHFKIKSFKVSMKLEL